MTQGNIYLDHNATTPIDPLVRENLDQWIDLWGNPSSIHAHGRGPKKILREARRGIAESLGCHPLELVFTSGGSEANNLAIQGCLQALKEKKPGKNKVVIGSIEHPSIMAQISRLEKWGYEVCLIPVDRSGKYDFKVYQELVDEKTALVSVMLANNEVGVIAPLKKMIEVAHLKGALFHSDCVQVLGKILFRIEDYGMDLASFSSHKLYAMKGAGVLYTNKKAPLSPLILGGAQERYRRAGTENLVAIASMGLMFPRLNTSEKKAELKALRDHMETQIQKSIEGVEIFCQKSLRLPNTSSLCVAGVSGEAMLMNLDIRGFSVGTGAACSSGNPEPSPVLLAMGISREQAQSSLRISIGKDTNKEQLDCFVEELGQVVKHLRDLEKNQGVANV